MPKKALLPTQHDEPVWDEMIADLGDPRPYEPAVPEFSKSYQPDDEPVIDPLYFDHLLYELAVECEAAAQELDAIREEADYALDEIWKWPHDRPLSSETRDRALALLTSSDAPTVVAPVLAEITQEIPVWPTT